MAPLIHPGADIHPSAVIAPGAVIGAGCRIGPFCVVGAAVVLGEGVELRSHVVVTGDTHIGSGSTVFSFAVVGEIPQDLKFDGEDSRLRIGARTRIREHVTINTGTAGGGGETRIGDDGLFMAGCHIAHDCRIGDRVIVVNAAAVAGHCEIGDDVIIGGLCGIHQWVRIGQGAIIGAVTMVTHDVIPHGLVQGPRGVLDGLNLVGLKRKGVSRTDIAALRAAFATLRDGDGAFQDRARGLEGADDSPFVRRMVEFILGDSDRQFLTPPSDGRRSAMLAVVGGTGPLPALLVAAEQARGGAVMVCELAGFPVAGIANVPLIRFRLEHLGSLLADLAGRGVTAICLAGVVRRPDLDPGAVDAATAPLVPRLREAMSRGDDGALRGVLAIFAEAGFAIRAAQDIAPDLLMPAGVPTRLRPDAAARADAAVGEATVAAMGRADTGQACVIRAGQVVASEGPTGTDAMLAGLACPGGLLFKAPKPDQDRRADLPTIGPATVRAAAAAGLAGIVIAADAVLVIDRARVIADCDGAGLYLWLRG